ncbi:glycosyltransferase [Marinobacter daepoensis]|uniref:glycosyltransferase n=1 Tax=Marinobacter daepoensis TaxID=262077 RepID=UPI0004092260|nr:glycosyltransferase [Marinobacter daepoensis]
MKNKLSMVYLCNFDLSGSTGKNRATRQKLSALRGKVSRLYVVSDGSKFLLSRIFSFIYLDVKVAFILISCKPDIFISRGYSGFFSILISRVLKITSAREIHANAIEESSLLPYKGIRLLAIKGLSRWMHALDRLVDFRIFNHPDLLAYFRGRGWARDSDFYVYNGFSPDSRSTISKSDARKKYGISNDAKVVVFVGTASKWHGVDYLVNLKKCFNKNHDDIEVVFGGGDVSKFDREHICLNISPLDDVGCSELIKASDFCLLPVKNNRVSPGSPLKLYDYIANERFVLAQSNTNGYSDEVERFGVGVSVDFTSTEDARLAILRAFEDFKDRQYPECAVSWDDRIDVWLQKLDIR